MTRFQGLRSRTLVIVMAGALSLVAGAAKADYRDLLVTNVGNGAISDFNRLTGAANAPFEVGATGNPTANPRGIVIGSNTNVYVGDIGKNALLTLSGNGALLNSTPFPTPSPAQPGGFQPQALVISPTNGLIYVDSGTATLSGTSSTALVNTYNTATNTFTPFTLSNLPAGLNSNFGALGLAFDPSGNLYVASSGNNAVFEFNPAGSFLRSFGAPTPSGIAINTGANILYAVNGSLGGQSISEFNLTTGALVGTITNANLLGAAPGGLLYDPATNRLYVAADLKQSVFAFNATTGLLDTTFANNGIAPIQEVYPAPFDNPQPIYLALLVTPVPEPSAVALMGLGLAGVVGAAVRKSRRASA